MRRQKQARHLLLVLLILALAACSQAAPSLSPPALPAVIVLPTTLFSTATITPTQSSPALTARPEVSAPIAFGYKIQFLGWSPNSRWLAYSEHTAADLAVNPQFPPGTLNLYDVTTGYHCRYASRLRQLLGARHWEWLPVNKLIAIEDRGRIVISTLCQPDYQDITRLFPRSMSEIVYANRDHSLLLMSSQKGYWLYDSPTGQVRSVQQVPTGSYDGYSFSTSEKHLAITSTLDAGDTVTYVVDPQSGEVEYHVEWRHREGLGGLPGPNWLNDEQFLIEETLDQGPLLVTLGAGTVQIARDWFNLSNIPTLLDPQQVGVRAINSIAQDSKSLHVVLAGVGSEGNYPRLQLYHRETGRVEFLPFTHLRITWGLPDTHWQEDFSPNGRWLGLYKPRAKPGDRSQVWLRSVDPPGSEARLLFETHDEPYPSWSPDSTRVALCSDQSISFLSVPDGKVVAEWQPLRYAASSPCYDWSPDGSHLAVAGHVPAIQDEALFVVPPPGPRPTPTNQPTLAPATTTPAVSFRSHNLSDSIYPAPTPSSGIWVSGQQCPNRRGIQKMDQLPFEAAFGLMRQYLSGDLDSARLVTDPAYWGRLADVAQATRSLNPDAVSAPQPANASPYADLVAAQCGKDILDLSWWMEVCPGSCRDAEKQAPALIGHLFLISRSGHWLVWGTYP